MWVAYCALPEPARKPVVMPANSTILAGTRLPPRWATPEPRLPCSRPSGFFLTDVEKAVEGCSPGT